eukprot:CAMPEP_0184492852 /NCGR_PEP_ID=MMETSP0113_2-20130426/24406_1 /TAXON_ID=91329 /ORGANISM="Norrisiella sphaerica, Strain BC52" /LENGTH=1182 /DNA_ID=CAMNT_0026877863 /DNA_START=173 /DNA_END=3721 /DNA_ORIENTATION=-
MSNDYDEIVQLIRKRCKEQEKIVEFFKKNKSLFLGPTKEKDINVPIGSGNSTVLHSAAWFVSAPVTKALLEIHANPNATNVKGNSALHLACQKLPESKELVEFLVEHNGNRYLKAADGKTPVEAVPTNMQQWFKEIRELNEEEKKLQGEVASGKDKDGTKKKDAKLGALFEELQGLITNRKCREESKIVETLMRNKRILSDGSVLDRPIGPGKSTLLHSAVWYKNLAVVKELVDAKANPNAQNVKMNSPLHLACEKVPETKLIVEALVRAGGNRYLQNADEKSAASAMSFGLKKWLLGIRDISPEEQKSKEFSALRKSVNADQANLLDPAKKKLSVKIYQDLEALVVKKKCREEDDILRLLDKHKELFCGSIRYMSIDAPANYGVSTSSSNSTLLHSAVWYQKVPVVQALLSCLASPNAQNVKGNSPLLLACEKLPEGKEIVELLVMNRGSLTKGNRFLAAADGSTPMKKTPENLRPWLLGLKEVDRDEKISKKDSDKSPRRRSGNTDSRSRKAEKVFKDLVQLTSKKRCKEESTIVALLNDNRKLFGEGDGFQDINAPVGSGQSTVLHSAAWFMSIKVIQALLAVRADPNARNVKNNTPLHLACEKLPASKAVVEMLVKAKANRFSKNISGKCAMTIVPDSEKDWLANLREMSEDEYEEQKHKILRPKSSSRGRPGLPAKGSGQAKLLFNKLNTIIVQRKCGDEKKIVEALEQSKSVFLGDKAKVNIDSPELLRASGSTNRSTFLHSAVWYNKLSIVQALVECKASPNAKNVRGNTPLHLACEKLPESKAIVEYLVLKAGGNRNIGNSSHKRPVDCASSDSLRQWILSLCDLSKEEVEAEKDRKAKRGRPNTARKHELMLQEERKAAKHDNARSEIIDLVMKKYCRDNERILSLLKTTHMPAEILNTPINSSKQTLLHVAAKLASAPIVRALLKAKASVRLTDIRQDTPLHLACDKLPKSKAVVQELVLAGGNRYVYNAKKLTPSSYVPARLRNWFLQLSPVSIEEKECLENRVKSLMKVGVDVARIRMELQYESKGEDTLANQQVIRCLVTGGIEQETADKHVKDFLRQHVDQTEDVVQWKVFLNEFVRMKLFHCVVLLGKARVFEKVDCDRSATLNLREFTKHLEQQLGREESHRQSRKLFKSIDANADGRLTKLELRMWYRDRIRALHRQAQHKGTTK